MNTKKKWYVVYTRSKWEKKVAELLTKKAIENYCPLSKVVKQWADRKKTIEEPLFNSYVFVRADEAEHLLIKQTDGVVNFVYWLGKPAVVKDNEIDVIKKYLNSSYAVTIEKINVHINDTVRITSGPLMQQEGNVIEVQGKSLKILLPSIGYAIIAIETNHIEVVTTSVETFTNLKSKSKQLLDIITTNNIFYANVR